MQQEGEEGGGGENKNEINTDHLNEAMSVRSILFVCVCLCVCAALVSHQRSGITKSCWAGSGFFFPLFCFVWAFCFA